MKDPVFFKACLGKSRHYADYLVFFQEEIAARGVEEVVREFVFEGDERADDIMARMYSGIDLSSSFPFLVLILPSFLHNIH